MVAQLCPAVELDRHWPKETALGYRGGPPTGTRGRLAGSSARHGRRRLRMSCIVELPVDLGCALTIQLSVAGSELILSTLSRECMRERLRRVLSDTSACQED
jgi:hypothetical protein